MDSKAGSSLTLSPPPPPTIFIGDDAFLQQSEPALYEAKKGEEEDEKEDEKEDKDFAIIYTLLQRFPKLAATDRHAFLLALLKQCDPHDMHYLYATLPTLHRDFLRLLPRRLAYEIIVRFPARDLCVAASVSREWRSILNEGKLWRRLYEDIGLASMHEIYYSPGKKVLANSKKLHAVRNWVRGKFRLRKVRAHRGGILGLAHEGKYAVSVGADRTCKLWDVRTGTAVRTMNGHEGGVLCVQFDQMKIITGSADQRVIVWSFATGLPALRCQVHKAAVTCLKYNKTILVTGSSDKTVKIWLCPSLPGNSRVGAGAAARSTARPQQKIDLYVGPPYLDDQRSSLRTLHGHASGVKCVDFNGDLLASGAIDGTLRIWHLSTGNVLRVIKPHVLNKTPTPAPTQTSMPRSPSSPSKVTFANPTAGEEQRCDPVLSMHFIDGFLAFGTVSGTVHVYAVAPQPIVDAASRRPTTTATDDPNRNVPLYPETPFAEMAVWANASKSFKSLRVFNFESSPTPTPTTTTTTLMPSETLSRNPSNIRIADASPIERRPNGLASFIADATRRTAAASARENSLTVESLTSGMGKRQSSMASFVVDAFKRPSGGGAKEGHLAAEGSSPLGKKQNSVASFVAESGASKRSSKDGSHLVVGDGLSAMGKRQGSMASFVAEGSKRPSSTKDGHLAVGSSLSPMGKRQTSVASLVRDRPMLSWESSASTVDKDLCIGPALVITPSKHLEIVTTAHVDGGVRPLTKSSSFIRGRTVRDAGGAADRFGVANNHSANIGGAAAATTKSWVLTVRMDRWRILAAGSDGLAKVWNHTTGEPIYDLNWPTYRSSSEDGPDRKMAALFDSPGVTSDLDRDVDYDDDDDGGDGGGPDDASGLGGGGVFGGGGDEDGETTDQNPHGKSITGIAFDDSYIVAGGMDGTLRIWDYAAVQTSI